MGAKFAIGAFGRRSVEQFPCPLDRQLVGSEILRHRCPLLTLLDVGPEPADPDHDSFARVADRDRVDGAGVDICEAFGHHPLEARPVRLSALANVPEIKAREPWQRLLVPAGYAVEVLFHLSGEAIVDQVGKVLLQ